MNPLIFTGIPIGLAFGFALSRGRFCMNSAFRDIIVLKEHSVLKAVGVASLVEMVGFTILAKTGLITISPATFAWGATCLAGLCSASRWYWPADAPVESPIEWGREWSGRSPR